MNRTSFFNKLKNFSKLDYALVRRSPFFNELWYKKTYKVLGDGALHYCRKGYKLGYSPSNCFSRIKYELIYDDVRLFHVNPLAHFERYGKNEPLFLNHELLTNEILNTIKKAKKQQNRQISKDYDLNARNLIVFLVPEFDTISGGVMSINSIAKISKDLKKIHHSDVILCTMPNPKTFFEYTKFECGFNVYRFEQLRRCFKKLENVIFHIPEIYVYPFLYFLSPEEELWLKGIKKTKLNILNQNMDYMPRPRYVNDYLKDMFDEVTMTCAHKKYCVPQLRTSYDVSVHFFSASNLVKYHYVKYDKKENILLYSPDEHPMRELILNRIKENYPDLKMIEIKNMKYYDYLKLIGKAKWMITFGEGLDGYFVESLRSGTVAFAAYNPVFFDDNYENLDNIYLDYNKMYENITTDIKIFDTEKKYSEIVKKCNSIDKRVYNDEEYKQNIKDYYLEKYTFPFSEVQDSRDKLLKREPLISIAVATYNGEKYVKKQIDSLLDLTYSNVEIIVSDDGSTDKTYSILQSYGNKITLLKNKGSHGLLNNFSNAIQKCNGEFIALCDQDDIWNPNKLEMLLEHIDNFDIVHGGVTIIDSDDNYHPAKYMHQAYEIDKTRFYRFDDYIRENLLLGCTCLIRKSFLDRYIKFPSDVIYHDWWIVLNAIKNGNGIVYLDKEVIKYRQHGKNTAFKTFNSSDWKEQKLKLNQCVLKYIPLSEAEKRLIYIDNNYVILSDTFKKYLPNDTYKFLKDNYYYLGDDFTKELLLNFDIYKNHH